ncbi:MAG: acyltransferase [Terrisporobacter sp.]|uniref:acyltransferase family protein n=1 Tax=Terrisporobacter sp. TaxID=1965305 RepID=UPI002FC868E6
MRRYEIDWIRNISILMLFVYHTSAIFCHFGDFYVVSEQKNLFADLLILLLFTWYMPMLFFLAGASTHFSLERRNLKEYVIERIIKLFIPLVCGILILVPPQTYLARVWRGEVNLNYLQHIKYFFSNVTDFTGFDGGFTPAHLWFILYLFVVSIVGGTLVFTIFKRDIGKKIIPSIKKIFCNKFSFISLLILGICTDIFPSIMGKSILGCLIIFLFGYIVYHDENILDKLIMNRFRFLGGFIIFSLGGVFYTFLLRPSEINSTVWLIDGLFKNGMLISAICTIVGFSCIHLNKSNKLLVYLNRSAFPVYLIHQPILLLLSCIIIPFVKSTTISMILIIIISFVITFSIYEFLNKVKIFNFMLGISSTFPNRP